MYVKQLVINNSNISSLEGISSFINLFYLDCSSNAIESLNLGGLLTLNTLLCHSNKLTSLNLVEIPELSNLVCGSNFLKNIDASNLLGLCLLHCENNPYLEFISVKGNSFCVFESNFSNNPKLVYVCANEKDIDDFGSYFLRNGITGVNVNSYCSFIPGGTFYTIQGTTKLNTNGNGCDVLDLPLSNLKFSITDGTISGSTIANITGNYAIPVQSGTFTVTPVLENLSYFTVSPTNTVVTFPTQTSPFNQDFALHPMAFILI
ncbi:MAG: hypothetical protein IPO23_07695 [Flavobacterium sp.]|nr:hypothetical protein [Flavobacterium sp.]